MDHPEFLSDSSDRLGEVARAALGEPEAEITRWEAEALRAGGVRAGAGGLWLVRGLARVGAVERPWRAVLRVLRPVAGQEDPTSAHYWKRELLLYRSGALDDLPPRLRAPRGYGWDERADETAWLWLEYIQEEGERVWPRARWALAARHLGRFNGAYLAGRSLPAATWLGGRRMRTWLEGHRPLVARIASAPDIPAVARWWPRPVVEAVLRLWDEREAFCAALERLPQTFGHGDAIRRNLFARRAADGSEETVAIDWENAGYYAAGEEVGQTLSVAAAFFDLDPGELPALDEALFSGYLQGLGDAGWRGDPRPVRFAYAAHAALRNLFNAVGASPADEAGRARALQTYGRTWEDLAERRAAIRPFLLERAEEARRLLDSLDKPL